MTHAEDLAYLRAKMGAAFEDLLSGVAAELRELDAEVSGGLPGSARIELGHLDIKAGRVMDAWRQPRPVRYRSKSA